MAADLKNPLPRIRSSSIARTDVAIVGAGAAGILAAIHINRLAPWLKLALVDGRATVGRGVAYGTTCGSHLLNVRASAMSAIASDPSHFVRWLAGVAPESGAGTFVPRALYGDYLCSTLASTPEPSSIRHVTASAVNLSRSRGGLHLQLDDGRTLHAASVILALGHLQPADPLKGACDSPRYVRDPWSPDLTRNLKPGERIFLLGSGLTMVDAVLALRRAGHRGQIHAVSRHGALPTTHRQQGPQTVIDEPPAGSPRQLLRWLRREVAQAARNGDDWRSVVDALRPHTAGVWQRWSTARRAAFLRHVRWAWDVHRHRMAPEVGAEIEDLVRSADLVVHRGRVRSVRTLRSSLAVHWRDTARGRSESHRVHRLVNCTGPTSDYGSADHPLIAGLRASGWLQPDPLGLGIQTGEDGELLDRDGAALSGVYVIGPARRATLWESTAIPEIRDQAVKLAPRVLRFQESNAIRSIQIEAP